jgi:hypothetical protein
MWKPSRLEACGTLWPYFLEDHFGNACLKVVSATTLAQFGDSDCLRVALKIRSPVMANTNLPVPFVLIATNPVQESPFCKFQIQTVREHLEDGDVTPFTNDDDPFDTDYGPPLFLLNGINKEGQIERISDRNTYAEAVSLAQKLVPGITFPEEPVSAVRPSVNDK